MQIMVFGALRLRGDEQETAPGPQEAALFAALLLARGGLVSSRRLVTWLWDDDDSDGMDNVVLQRRITTLRSHATHLRKRLATVDLSGSTKVISSGIGEARGYQLLLGQDDEVDAHLFERLVAQAKEEARDQHPDQVIALADQALGRWDGPPYAGMEKLPAVMAETRRLLGLKADAFQLRVDAMLALGRHAEAHPELKDLVEQFPHRAGLHCSLMLAAYRMGYRDEALAIYDAARRTLQDLGVDRAALEQLRTKVLRRAPELAWAPLVPVPRGPVLLPRDVRGFVGRSVEIRWLADLTRDAGSETAPLVVALFGTPGIGKSALVNHVANKLSDRFDVILTARLDSYGPSPYTAQQELATFLRLLKVADAEVPHDVRAASALLSTLLASRRALVVVDDAARASDVEPFIPAAAQHVVLVTSRSELADLDGAITRRLDVLTVVDATDLLATFVPRRRLTAEPDALAFLIEWCGAMPLALRIVGALLRTRADWRVQAFSDWLVEDPLDKLQVGERDVAASIRRSYQTLAPSTARLFRLLGALRVHDVSVDVAVSLAGGQVQEALADLRALEEAQLIDVSGPERYQLHHVVRLFAQHAAVVEGDPVEERVDVVLGAYARRLVAVDRSLFDEPAIEEPGVEELSGDGAVVGFPDRDAATAWLEPELRNLVALAQWEPLRERPVAARFLIHLNWWLRRFFDLRSRWEDWAITATAAMAAAHHLGDSKEEGYAHRDLGIVAARRGQFDEATERFGSAGALLHDAEDRFGEAAVVNNLALTLLLRGRPEEAVPALERARTLFLDLKDTIRTKTVTMNLGEAYRRIGRLDAALGEFQQALVDARALGDRVDEGKTLHNLGETHRELGHLDEAASQYLASIVVFDETGDQHTRALSIAGLGLIAVPRGDLDIARERLADALRVLERLGSADAEDVRTHLDRLPPPAS